MTNLSSKWIMVFGFLPLLISGCAVATRTPSLSSDQKESIKNVKYDIVIGVDEGNSQPKLYELLQKTEMFTDVVHHDEGKDYDILAKRDGRWPRNPAFIPLLAIFSLGIIPEFHEGEIGVRFSLQDKDKQEKVYVDGVADGDCILGWLAVFASLLPQYELITSETSSSRYMNYLKYAINSCEDCKKLLSK